METQNILNTLKLYYKNAVLEQLNLGNKELEQQIEVFAKNNNMTKEEVINTFKTFSNA